eukprot:CAMPEP_0168313478 /NCGR_PEP_ID=MMETSP0210-20121227/2151_1 /TAXON_ID=40633 /ORGANISM="Condylostoma magnum, Strain COL2" /LENGTH=61 /DNA_ID=CAMNT_0008270415 /DNA_START=841 /DNA_END=1026 /DNA_ORIENTATION=+
MQVEEPLHDIQEIAGLFNPDLKTSFDVRLLISRVLDGSKFHEFKPEYGESLVTGFGSLYGH